MKRQNENISPVIVVDVAHEALIRHWPLLKGWINEDRDALRKKHEIETAAEEWKAQDKSKHAAYFMQGPKLNIAEEYLTRYADKVPLSNLAQEFVQKSIKHKQKKRYLLISIVTTVILVLAGIAFYAKTQQIEAQKQEKLAKEERDNALRTQSLFLADLARQEIDKGNFVNGILLALEALPKNIFASNKRPYVLESEQALYKSIAYLREQQIFQEHESSVVYASFNSDGSQVVTISEGYTVTASEEHTIHLWNVRNGKLIFKLHGHKDKVLHAAFSFDSNYLVTTSRDKTAHLWDIQNGQLFKILPEHSFPIIQAIFSPNGTKIVTVSSTVNLWDIQSGTLIKKLKKNEFLVEHAPFNADSLQTITIPINSELFKILQQYENIEEILKYSAFSPDGKNGITIYPYDKIAHLWDIQTGNLKKTLQEHEWWIKYANFSPDSTKIITCSSDKTARLWDAQNGQEIAVLQGHDGIVSQAKFSHDSMRVVTVSTDKTARVWSTDGLPLFVLRGHKDTVKYAVFSHDGKYVVTTSEDKTARLWNVTDESMVTLRLDDYRLAEKDVMTDVGMINKPEYYFFIPNEVPAVIASRGTGIQIGERYISSNPQVLIDYGNYIIPRCLTSQQRKQFYLLESKSQSFIDDGKQLAQKGKLKEAIAKFQKAIDIEPCHKFDPEDKARYIYANTLVENGEQLAEEGEINEAINQFKKAQKVDPRFKFSNLEDYAKQIADSD